MELGWILRVSTDILAFFLFRFALFRFVSSCFIGIYSWIPRFGDQESEFDCTEL